MKRKPGPTLLIEDELSSGLHPSAIDCVPWIHAHVPDSEYPERNEFSGKWLVFVPTKDLDATWHAIRLALEEGKLGRSAKTATAMPNPNAQTPETKVICIYTYDYRDESDVMRIRKALRALGITRKIPYKADKTTRAGKYSNRGHSGTSMFYE